MARYENRYEQIRDVLQTGDILLFSSDSPIMRLWKRLTACHWTHVGIAMRSAETDQLLLWESTPLKTICDVHSHMAQSGVQVVLLSLRTATYRGEVSYRRLDFSQADAGVTREDLSRKLTAFRQAVKNRPFEADLGKILKAFIDITKSRRKGADLRRVFCSELVAAAFKHAGFIDEGLPDEEYTPKDFVERPDILGKGVKLGPIRIFKFKPQRLHRE
ncbi:MAG: hypothetical protein PVF97_04965 [Desulfobacterales bacterium]|jgi:transcriptional regulator of met regulon